MRQLGLTLQERQLILLLRWWVGLFSAAGICFAIFPAEAIYWLNTIGHVIFGWPFQNLPLPAEHFWQVLAVSLLVVITAISFDAASDIRQNLSNVKFIIISKIATTLGFLMAIFLSGPYFAYVVGAAVDFFILVATWYCYNQTCTSRAL